MMEPIPYSPGDEVLEPDEVLLFARIVDAMSSTAARAPAAGGPGERLSHLKTLAALEGELRVDGQLAPELAQGLFHKPRRYAVVARLSHLPAERLDDRGVSSPRGLAIRLLNVDGPPAGELEVGLHDFVLETGKAFNAATPRSFLTAFGMVEAAAALPQGVKAMVSAGAQGANAVLSKANLHSANLDVLGHPRRHPLSECYYSQAPIRWGAYVAKLGVFPEGPQAPLEFKADEAEALRNAIADWCCSNATEFVIKAQLRTDAAAMPIEDASVVWPEELSSYRPVARLVFPPQDPHDVGREVAVNALAFSPGNAVEAHRGLGGIMRARAHVYGALGAARLKSARSA